MNMDEYLGGAEIRERFPKEMIVSLHLQGEYQCINLTLQTEERAHTKNR